MKSTTRSLPFCSAGNGWFGIILATNLIQFIYVDYRLKTTFKNIEIRLETMDNRLKDIDLRLDRCKNLLK